MESVRRLFVNLMLFLLNYFVLCPAKIVQLYYAYCNLIEIHLYHKIKSGVLAEEHLLF